MAVVVGLGGVLLWSIMAYDVWVFGRVGVFRASGSQGAATLLGGGFVSCFRVFVLSL